MAIPSDQYQLMIYFAVGTLHFYRNDIVPISEGETLGIFVERNKEVLQRVKDEAIKLFQYELSHEQEGRAIKAYLATPRPMSEPPAFLNA